MSIQTPRRRAWLAFAAEAPPRMLWALTKTPRRDRMTRVWRPPLEGPYPLPDDKLDLVKPKDTMRAPSTAAFQNPAMARVLRLAVTAMGVFLAALASRSFAQGA